MGKRNLLVADRLLETLVRDQRLNEVQQFLNEVPFLLKKAPQLFDRASPALAGWQSEDELVAMAEQWVAEAPDEPSSHLRLGRILIVAASQAENEEQAARMRTRAAESLATAVRLAPNDPRTWIAAIVLQAQEAPSRERALALMEQFAAEAKIDPLERAFVLAQLFEAVGTTSQAAPFYAESIRRAREEQSPALGRILERAARFCAASGLSCGRTVCSRSGRLRSRFAPSQAGPD